MNYRNEWKHEISYSDMTILRQRLSKVMKQDLHAINGKYFIRSLYFDNYQDKALREKIDGIDIREKFRIRYYNHDTSLIHLEKKCKINNLCLKDSVPITKQQAQKIIENNNSWMMDSNENLIQELYSKMNSQNLRPKTIVDYCREPFIFPYGNVRVTIDYDIRTAIKCVDFLNPNCITVQVADCPIILEVKWDEYLPDIIKDVVQLPHCQATAFSKYATCRIYD